MRSDNMALYRDLTLYNFVYIESGWLLLSFEMRAMTTAEWRVTFPIILLVDEVVIYRIL